MTDESNQGPNEQGCGWRMLVFFILSSDRDCRSFMLQNGALSSDKRHKNVVEVNFSKRS